MMSDNVVSSPHGKKVVPKEENLNKQDDTAENAESWEKDLNRKIAFDSDDKKQY